jgi:DNA polymerase III subunit gamma/tau
MPSARTEPARPAVTPTPPVQSSASAAPTSAAGPRETIASAPPESAADGPAPESAPEPAATSPNEDGAGLDTAALRRIWPDVLARIFTMRRVTWTFLSQHAQVVDFDGQRLVLGIATVGLANTFRAGNHAELVRQALIDEIGVDVPVEGVPMPDPGQPSRASAASAAPTPPASAPEPPQTVDWPEPEPPTDSSPELVPQAPDNGSTSVGQTASKAPQKRAAHTSRPQAPATPDADWQASAAPAPAWASDAAPDPSAAANASASETSTAGRRQVRSGSSDDAVSEDDEDVATSVSDGRAVVERVLGGQFLGELED